MYIAGVLLEVASTKVPLSCTVPALVRFLHLTCWPFLRFVPPVFADLGTRVRTVAARDVRGINLNDFRAALPRVLPSVSKKTVER